MEISFLFARLLGPLFAIIGIALLWNPERIQGIGKEFLQNPALLFLIGLIRLLLGMLIITFHNSWVQSWEVIVTLIGWLAVINGALILVFAEGLSNMIKPLLKKKSMFVTAGIIVLVLGGYLIYMGYMA